MASLRRNDSTMSRLSHLLDEHGDGSQMIEGEGRKWEHLRKDPVELKGIKNKGLRAFYERQNEILNSYAEVDTLLYSTFPSQVLHSFSRHHPKQPTRYGALESRTVSRAHSVLEPDESNHHRYGEEEEGLLSGKELGKEEKDRRKDRKERVMLNVNILVNVLLVASKGAAVVISNSISLLASLVDSSLDLLSTGIIWGTSLAAEAKDTRTRYPTGKQRFEPLGVLIFSVFMISSFSQVFIESIQRLAKHDDNSEAAELSLFGKGTMLATILIKGVIWWWCGSGDPGPGVGALAQDARNDVWFNTMSLLFPWVGERFSLWWLDPLGGVVLSIYIIYEWLQTLHENFINLSGRMADHDEFCRILYLVSRFKGIIEISEIQIYHVGEDFIVEVDVILPPNTSLHCAHDLVSSKTKPST
ncbi:cation efflux family-domain-containing protein [Mrakia frigida]|uniref:cation diffusion facilitator family transporter n=1 Tax=Mrakia frigida TaxID=29902 RepID=UPI003FCC0F7D